MNIQIKTNRHFPYTGKWFYFGYKKFGPYWLITLWICKRMIHIENEI